MLFGAKLDKGLFVCYHGDSISDLLYEAVWQTAQGSGRTFYDSLYLALAASTDTPLVTADQRLHRPLHNGPWGQYCLWVKDETLAA